MMTCVKLDVSLLAPPEPMTKIILALSTLEKNHYLQVIHRREPFPLYENLTANGWLYHCKKLADEHFHIYIYHQDSQIDFENTLIQLDKHSS